MGRKATPACRNAGVPLSRNAYQPCLPQAGIGRHYGPAGTGPAFGGKAGLPKHLPTTGRKGILLGPWSILTRALFLKLFILIQRRCLEWAFQEHVSFIEIPGR